MYGGYYVYPHSSLPNLNLDSGAVINWNAGDVTLTHSANTLTFSGASTGYDFQTGPLTSLSSIVSKSGTGNLSATEVSNTIVLVTAAATVSLPTAAAGYCALIVSTTAAVVSVDLVTGTDVIILNGTALTAGNKATSDGTDEATILVVGTAAGTYRAYTVQGVWSDGGS